MSEEERRVKKILKKIFVLNGWTVAFLVVVLLVLIFLIIEQRQSIAIKDAYPSEPAIPREQFEIAKLRAEIQQIRSDTSGSLFWLKLIGVLVTVGGAVGGYLLAQTRTQRERIEFEDRKNVDLVYQSIIQELSNASPLLRAAAAVKLGSILEDFPAEWNVTEKRQAQIKQLTKQVLAAALATEDEPKVLKTLTIAIALDKIKIRVPVEKKDVDKNEKPVKKKRKNKKEEPVESVEKTIGLLKGLDLSNAIAEDAYWAKIDFSYTDFYKAVLTQTSFREANLTKAQFREANLSKAVLIAANCGDASFKLADLSGANLSGADLREADFTETKISLVNFEKAKVYGAKLDKVRIGRLKQDVKVDNSPNGDGSQMITVKTWLEESGNGASA